MFSLGSHGQVDFEEAVRDRYPHCRIFVYDHTLDDKQRAAVLAVDGDPSTDCADASIVVPCASLPCALASNLDGNQCPTHVTGFLRRQRGPTEVMRLGSMVGICLHDGCKTTARQVL